MTPPIPGSAAEVARPFCSAHDLLNESGDCGFCRVLIAALEAYALSRVREELQEVAKALERIRDYREEPFDYPAEEWAKHTPETCAECKRWQDMKHPLQHSCDGWYRLFYSRESKREDQEMAMGYRLRAIARDALYSLDSRLRALSEVPAQDVKEQKG